MEQHLQGLDPVRSLSWSDVFAFWRESEGESSEWLAVAKERGYETWEAWRLAYAPYFRLQERMWELYSVPDPLRTVPAFRGAPFQGWIERTYGEAGAMPTFETIAAKLAVNSNARVASILRTFPRRTTVLGLLTDNGIVIFEGMHRCSALASAAASGASIVTDDFQIALGGYLPGDLPVIPKLYKNPSTRG